MRSIECNQIDTWIILKYTTIRMIDDGCRCWTGYTNKNFLHWTSNLYGTIQCYVNTIREERSKIGWKQCRKAWTYMKKKKIEQMWKECNEQLKIKFQQEKWSEKKINNRKELVRKKSRKSVKMNDWIQNVRNKAVLQNIVFTANAY